MREIDRKRREIFLQFVKEVGGLCVYGSADMRGRSMHIEQHIPPCCLFERPSLPPLI